MSIFTKIPKKNYKYSFVFFVQTMILLFLMSMFSDDFRKKIPVDWQTPSIVVALIILFFCLRYTINFQMDYFESDETE